MTFREANTKDKWESMISAISQYPATSPINLSRQFNKIVISRLIWENALLFLLQYMGLMFSAITDTYTPVWLASGTACAFVFLRGLTVLPGIFLGGFFAYSFAHVGMPVAFICASIFTLQPALLLIISYRYISPILIFQRVDLLIKFLICLAVIASLTSYIYLRTCLSLFSMELFTECVLANCIGILSVACAITAWDLYFPQINSIKITRKLSLIYGLFIVCIITSLFSTNLPLNESLILATLPLFIIISLRYGLSGTLCASFIFAMIISFGAYFSAPLFNSDFSLFTVDFLQKILLIETIIGMYISIRLIK